jgi:hypothetical protein
VCSSDLIAREVLSLEKSLNFYVDVLGKKKSNTNKYAGFTSYNRLFRVSKDFKLFLDRHLIAMVTGCMVMGSVYIWSPLTILTKGS